MENTQPQIQKPISDDQELAKVLAGVQQNSEELQIEEPVETEPAEESKTASAPVAAEPEMPEPVIDTTSFTPTAAVDAKESDLENIKKDALSELKPLVNKLQLEPEEMFDIYLLLLRSTDDKALIAPAHAAAKNITDETRRAQALLDVIKEIDFLSTP